MTYTPVGINAPTLDNSDECKIIRNEDLLYATAGNPANGPVANLALYEKFIDSGCHSLYDSPDISRRTFNSGAWAMPDNSNDQPWNGGDYYLTAFSHIKADLFRTGKLNGFRFKFFTKDSYTTDTPQLLIPNTGNITDKNELWDYINDKTTNPGVVTRVVLLVPNIVNDDQNGWKFGAFAKLDLDSLPSEANDWYNFKVESDFYISTEFTNKLNYSFVLFFLPNADNWVSSNNKVEEIFKPGIVYSGQSLRNIVGNGDSDRVVVMRSAPRGSLDGISYVYAPTTDTSDGTRNGQNRLLELEYCMDTDLVDEYLTDNASKHHLDIKEVQELNTLRYSAPMRPDESWEPIKAAVTRIFISDNSLTRNGNIDLIGKPIKSIRIPFSLGERENYIVNDMFNNHLMSRIGGLCHTNRKVKISLDGGQTEIESTNYFAYSYFKDHMVYEWFFDADDPAVLKYSGHGIRITGGPPAGQQGNNTLAVDLFKKGSKYYAYSDGDIIDTTHTNYKNINATPAVKILFDYMQRGDWFDYVENRNLIINENISAIENDIINVENTIKEIYNISNTYSEYINDRIRFKWVEFCPTHSLPLSGILKQINIVMSSNQWTDYTNPAYLCLYEKSENEIFVKKAVSVNSLIPRKSAIESWFFDDIELSGQPIRIGLIENIEDGLAEIGETQNNVSLQTNAVTSSSGYDGDCYVCDDNGARKNFSCPTTFIFGSLISNIENNIDDIKNTISNIETNITNITERLENAESTLGSLGKWRIYVNDLGDLVIDTEALAAAGKSVIFKDIEG